MISADVAVLCFSHTCDNKQFFSLVCCLFLRTAYFSDCVLSFCRVLILLMDGVTSGGSDLAILTYI